MRKPGRTCPLSYRYGPETLCGPAPLRIDTLWVAGGLYGNPFALQTLLDAYATESGTKALVFNGDFHWFDIDPRDFAAIDTAVLAHHATRGNVETELAAPAPDAGCGCAYPEWVNEETVEHSNRIIERLRCTAQRFPDAVARLAALPMHLVAEVAGLRVGVVHGDAESLAGWEFSQEMLATRRGLAEARSALDRAGVEAFACSHTCLPVLQQFSDGRLIVNNGAAGMPNFRGERYGLATRISTRPHRAALYGARCGRVFVEAVPLRYDSAAWQARFLAAWPAGSSAYASYWERMVHGPSYTPDRALRLLDGATITRESLA